MQSHGPTRQRRFLSVTHSIHLPSNLLLTQSPHQQPRTTARTSFRQHDTADPYRYSATIDLANQTHFVAATAAVRTRPKRQIEKEVMKHWIVEKEQTDQKSLAQRLRNMRVDNCALEEFSLSKLLSKIRVLKEPGEEEGDLGEEGEEVMRRRGKEMKKTKKVVRPRLFRFTDANIQKTIPPPIYNSVQMSSARRYQDQQSTKIFKKYFCPPSSYRDPSYFDQLQPDDKYIYRDGKKVQCKRIHNFYTSHMYKRGYSRHYKKIEDDELLARTDGFHK